MRSEYGEEFEAFSEAFVRARYLYASGRSARLDLEPVFDRYGYLFEPDEVAALGAAAGEAFYERDRKALGYLRAAAAARRLDAVARPLDEEIAAHDARATVRWEGRDVAFAATRALVAREARAGARRALDEARSRVVEEANDLRAERLEKRRGAVEALGGASPLALWTELRGVDYAGLAGVCRRLLAATERPYVEALEPALAARAGARPSEATRADALHAFRLPEYDRAFPASRVRVVYREALAGLGVRTGAQSNVTLDLDDRPTKRARAFCAPIRVPGEVVVALRPAGGYGAHRELLHAAGHAQHAAFTSPETRVGFRRAGDAATSETYACLLERLPLDRDFAGELFGLAGARAFLATAALERAYRVRCLAGRMVYVEWLAAGGSLSSARERYGEALAEATRVRPSEAGYLADADDVLSVAARLRALALEVQARDVLKTRYGRRWWASRPAGELLKELWATGHEYSADDLARELGTGAISFDALEVDLVEGLAP
jgi:hypothetical protein